MDVTLLVRRDLNGQPTDVWRRVEGAPDGTNDHRSRWTLHQQPDGNLRAVFATAGPARLIVGPLGDILTALANTDLFR